MVAAQVVLGLLFHFFLGPDTARAIALAIAPTVLAASFRPTDGHANPIKSVQAFA